MKKTIVFSLAASLFIGALIKGADIDLVPEPGVVIYGQILAADGETAIPASEVRIRLSRLGKGNSDQIVADLVVDDSGEQFYVANFPFYSRVDGNGPVGFSSFDPDQETPDTFQFASSGNAAVFQGSSDNVVAVESDKSVTSFDFGSGGVRGGVFRMDILTDFVIQNLVGYDEWIFEYESIPGDERGKQDDFDKDGSTNEQEWVFGTDPTNQDPNDKLHRLVVRILPVDESGPNTIEFYPKWNDGREYTILKSTSPEGDSFAPPSPMIPIADGDTISDLAVEASAVDAASNGQDAVFYRVEVTLETGEE